MGLLFLLKECAIDLSEFLKLSDKFWITLPAFLVKVRISNFSINLRSSTELFLQSLELLFLYVPIFFINKNLDPKERQAFFKFVSRIRIKIINFIELRKFVINVSPYSNFIHIDLILKLLLIHHLFLLQFHLLLLGPVYSII